MEGAEFLLLLLTPQLGRETTSTKVGSSFFPALLYRHIPSPFSLFQCGPRTVLLCFLGESEIQKAGPMQAFFLFFLFFPCH